MAKPRFAAALVQVKRKKTGSHTGFHNRLEVSARRTGNDPRASPLFSGVPIANLVGIYKAERWDPEKYWKHEDYVWRVGAVLIGPLQDVKAAPTTP